MCYGTLTFLFIGGISMSTKKKIHKYIGDFETTVYDGQTNTQVWASAIADMESDNVFVLHSIDETYEWCKKQKGTIRIYYHNLSFDGCFWLYYLTERLDFKQAFDSTSDEDKLDGKWRKTKDLKSREYILNMSDKGMWYSLTFKIGRTTVELYDSYKLLPFSVKAIGKAFQTKHRKLDMDYEGFRYPGCEITEKEREYIINDVLVVKEALQIMFEQGHDKMTIGACCLGEYKNIIKKMCFRLYGKAKPTDEESWFRKFFPDITKIKVPLSYSTTLLEKSGEVDFNADTYIRKSYAGGWCYVVPEKANTIIKGGLTADVNSLYPSAMHSESGNKYPYGKPTFWKGNRVPEIAYNSDKYFFVRIRCRFYLKEGFLPFIHIRNDYRYRGNMNLTTSDVYNPKTGKYERFTKGKYGMEDTICTMTLTCTDFELFLRHYRVEDFEILDGCYFNAKVGLFDGYINKYAEIKKNSKGALRTLAKLFLNNLYGKFATSTDSSFKVPYTNDEGLVRFRTVLANDKTVGYIPVGSAITSYARYFTITHAQENYHGPNERGFIYADTDSIHCDLTKEELVNIKVHPTNFNCWKLETYWDKAIFVRQKTYIEHVTHEDEEELEEEKRFYLIKGAGLPSIANGYLNCALQNKDIRHEYGDKDVPESVLVLPKTNTGDIKKLDDATKEWILSGKDLTDYCVGMVIPSGNLKSSFIKGGKLLIDKEYIMRETSLY